MHLGKRCDEIVRLIDETLIAVLSDVHADDEQPLVVSDGTKPPLMPVDAVVHRRRWSGGHVRL
jgi:hypothetical protein